MTRLTAHRGHALLIGIDEYPHFPRGVQLAGAAADAECLGALLIRQFGFAPADVDIVTHERATRAGIIQALDRLLSRVERGDRVWFHYSGHGARRPAPRNRFRADAQEYVLVPRDSAHDGHRPNVGISGDELHAWLRHLAAKTARVTLVFDCCHAGVATREGEEDGFSLPRGRMRSVEDDHRLPSRQAFPWTPLDRSLPRARTRTWLAVQEAYTMITACRVDQKAREVTIRDDHGKERTHGALSQALLDVLPLLPDGATYRDLRDHLEAAVRARYPRQHPQVEGADERLLMRLATRPGQPALSVLARTGRRVVLNGGRVHGVMRGSLWAIRPPGAPPSSPAVEARVTLVGGVRSDARLLAPTDAQQVREGSRAIQTAPGMDAGLRVAFESPAIHAPWMAQVVAAVDEAPSLRRVHEPARADVVVAVVGPRATAGSRERAAVLGALPGPVAVVVDRQNQIVLPIRRYLDSQARAETVTALERLARHRRLAALANPQANPLAGRVKLQLMRRTKDDMAWRPARSPQPRFDDNEAFAITVTNSGDVPVYAHVLALGVGGGVGLVFPQGGSCEALAPGHTVWAGDRSGMELWFEVPDTLPFEDPGAPWVGTETLLLIVSTDATDLRPLLQPRYRDDPQAVSADTTLDDRLGDILRCGYREVKSGHSPRSVAWHAETVSVRLRRPRKSGP